VFKAAGTITGLYREDYGYNATAASFVMYRDVWREIQFALTTLTNNTDDSYAARIYRKKKDVN
jgi:hypothetical protein